MLAGCGDRAPGEDSATATTTSTSTTGASTTGASTTGESSSESDADTDTDAPPFFACVPGEADLELSLPLDLTGAHDWPCTVDAAAEDPEGRTWTLTCDDDGVVRTFELRVASAPLPPPLLEGESVRVQLDVPVFYDFWLRIEGSGGELRLAAATTPSLPAERVATFFAPLSLRVGASDCAPQFECGGDVERVPLIASVGGLDTPLFDGSQAVVAGAPTYALRLAYARHYIDVKCRDIPSTYYELMLVPVDAG
ncbi:MAG: hypothetical protein R3A79_17750 [Nannocystaceae bacterium]